MSAIYRNGKWYGKDNGHIIMNNAGLELKPRATLQFGGDLSTTDDNTNERTVIKPHEISPEEWDDIVNLLPGGVSNNGIVIDTRGKEYIVGKYIESDGTIKPIYQKVYIGNTGTTKVSEYIIPGLNVENMVNVLGYVHQVTQVNNIMVPFGMHLSDVYYIHSFFDTIPQKLTLNKGNGYDNFNFYAVLQYTKTTD